MRHRAVVLLIFLGTLPWLSNCVGADGNPQAGRRVADQWCSECHRVAPDQPSGARPGHTLPAPVEAPSFMAVAARPGIDAYQLERFLHELHPPMPTYRLYPAERIDVVAYILSLKPAQ